MLHVWIHHLHTAIALGGHHARLSWSLRLRLELLLLTSSLPEPGSLLTTCNLTIGRHVAIH